MKIRNALALCGAVGAILASDQANAALNGLYVVSVAPGPGPAPGPRTILHVFAEFTNPTDRVNTWGGGGNLGAGGIQNLLGNNTTLGTGFTNIGGAGGQLSPYSPGTTRDYDTYMTIGVRYGQQAPGGLDASILLPGTPNFILGNNLVFPVSGGGVTVTPADPQGRADFIVGGSSGHDDNLRVLLMQLVVNVGEAVRGTIGVNWQSAGGPATNTSGLTFHYPIIPAPNALGLLGLASLVGSRRRRA